MAIYGIYDIYVRNKKDTTGLKILVEGFYPLFHDSVQVSLFQLFQGVNPFTEFFRDYGFCSYFPILELHEHHCTLNTANTV